MFLFCIFTHYRFCIFLKGINIRKGVFLSRGIYMPVMWRNTTFYKFMFINLNFLIDVYKPLPSLSNDHHAKNFVYSSAPIIIFVFFASGIFIALSLGLTPNPLVLRKNKIPLPSAPSVSSTHWHHLALLYNALRKPVIPPSQSER